MIAEISAAINGVKVAMEMTKGLMAVDNALAAAEAKGKLVDVMDKLVDTKRELLELSEIVDARDKEIAELKQRLQRSGEVVRQHGAYYERDADGIASGDPYCPRCFEGEGRLFHMTIPDRQLDNVACPECRRDYPFDRAPPIRRR